MHEADGDAGVLGVPPRLRKLTAEERRILMLPHQLTTTSAPGSRSATGALVIESIELAVANQHGSPTRPLAKPSQLGGY